MTYLTRRKDCRARDPIGNYRVIEAVIGQKKKKKVDRKRTWEKSLTRVDRMICSRQINIALTFKVK